MAKRKLMVQGVEIQLFEQNKSDYISLTDIAKNFGTPADIIKGWIRNNGTVTYLSTWEQMYNENFDYSAAAVFALELGDNTKTLTPSRWIETTRAVGIQTKSGRGGGTYAHTDITLNFCYWLNPSFQVFFIKELQRLKEQEATLSGKEWSMNRYLSRINYHILTDSVKEFLVKPKKLPRKSQGIVYASEADLLNKVLFGLTAKEWRLENTDKPVGKNIRDYALPNELHVLANLEVLNSFLIRMGVFQQKRMEILQEAAQRHADIIEETGKLQIKKQLKNKGKQ